MNVFLLSTVVEFKINTKQEENNCHLQTGLKFNEISCEMLQLEHFATWTLRKVDQKYLGSLEMWIWRRLETASWTDCVRNEEVLL
jgi:hypothetical protein